MDARWKAAALRMRCTRCRAAWAPDSNPTRTSTRASRGRNSALRYSDAARRLLPPGSSVLETSSTTWIDTLSPVRIQGFSLFVSELQGNMCVYVWLLSRSDWRLHALIGWELFRAGVSPQLRRPEQWVCPGAVDGLLKPQGLEGVMMGCVQLSQVDGIHVLADGIT